MTALLRAPPCSPTPALSEQAVTAGRGLPCGHEFGKRMRVDSAGRIPAFSELVTAAIASAGNGEAEVEDTLSTLLVTAGTATPRGQTPTTEPAPALAQPSPSLLAQQAATAQRTPVPPSTTAGKEGQWTRADCEGVHRPNTRQSTAGKRVAPQQPAPAPPRHVFRVLTGAAVTQPHQQQVPTHVFRVLTGAASSDARPPLRQVPSHVFRVLTGAATSGTQ